MRVHKILPLLLLSALPVLAQATGHEAFNKPFPAYKVIGNVYFVGTDDLGSFLITTPEGNILINSDFDDTVPQIKASVEKLGFKFSDIKILLGSHAHGDHMEGDALVKQLTGVQVMAMAEDMPALENMNPGVKLVNNTGAPNIVAEFIRAFQVSRALPCDIPLGSHPGMFNLQEKYA